MATPMSRSRSAGLRNRVTGRQRRCAIGLLTAFRRACVDVPGTVSVAGYDDDTLSRLDAFDLTTVSQNAEEQARQAVTAAVDRLEGGRTVSREIVLAPSLVVRGTTAEPR
jgi:DNA-binding LacI/PurR family transcriptional regulator